MIGNILFSLGIILFSIAGRHLSRGLLENPDATDARTEGKPTPKQEVARGCLIYCLAAALVTAGLDLMSSFR